MNIQNLPIATTAMLIRKPVSEVFEAFVNPVITSKFWFTQGNDRLQAGKQIRWDWEMYNHSVQVNVKVAGSRIYFKFHGKSQINSVLAALVE